MRHVNKVTKTTENRFLNMYEMDMVNEEGEHSKYFVASRAEKIADLKQQTGDYKPDGVCIYSVYQDEKDKKEKVVLIRQYRCPIGDYIYEFPAGLVDEGETMEEAAVREMREETGLELEVIPAKPMFSKPYFTTIGMTDETCGTMYGYASGTPSKEGQEENEEIEIVLADREEVKRILEEEPVSIMCAYMMMHFLHTSEGHVFDFLGVEQNKKVKLTAEQEAKQKNDELIDRLVSYRKRLKMTQQDVADITGIKRANIARLEGKKFLVSTESLVKYAKSVGCDLRLEVVETHIENKK